MKIYKLKNGLSQELENAFFDSHPKTRCQIPLNLIH